VTFQDFSRSTALRQTLSIAVGVLTFAGAETAAQPSPTLDDARQLFYNAHYREAAELALTLQTPDPDDDLARDELRASALLFQLRALLEPLLRQEGANAKTVERCAACVELMTTFTATTTHGQRLARARLDVNPADETALFFLGKLDLNYLWLQLGLLRRKTGWNEYWEARRSLDALLKTNPQHVRARVARAWIDYIVHTKMPWGARWVLGGGDKKRALVVLHEVAADDTDFFSHAEAEFSLWDILVREKHLAEATDVAERLATKFPANREVATFLQTKRP